MSSSSWATMSLTDERAPSTLKFRSTLPTKLSEMVICGLLEYQQCPWWQLQQKLALMLCWGPATSWFGVSLECFRESHMSRRFRRYLNFAVAVGWAKYSAPAVDWAMIFFIFECHMIENLLHNIALLETDRWKRYFSSLHQHSCWKDQLGTWAKALQVGNLLLIWILRRTLRYSINHSAGPAWEQRLAICEIAMLKYQSRSMNLRTWAWPCMICRSFRSRMCRLGI